jgi:N-acetylmuramoyl-L-alanine amidase
MKVIDAPSPNHGDRRGCVPDLILIHHTAMPTAEAAVERLRDPAAEVSAHYVIAEDGRVWRLVPEDRRAWHAGAGAWGDLMDVNTRSIGIELANFDAAPYAEAQWRALVALLDDIRARRAIPPERVIGHQCMAPRRKSDPGRAFDWRRLARAGHAIWLDGSPGRAVADAAAFRCAARAFGYPLLQGQGWDEDARAVADAFQARFRPWETGLPTVAGLAQLQALAARWPAARA